MTPRRRDRHRAATALAEAMDVVTRDDDLGPTEDIGEAPVIGA